jgi:hypothetical protein
VQVINLPGGKKITSRNYGFFRRLEMVIRSLRITAAETPTLAEMIAPFDPDRHGWEVMVSEPVGVERM